MTDLESEDFWLNKGKRFAVDLDETFAFLCLISVHGYFHPAKMLVVPCSGRPRLL